MDNYFLYIEELQDEPIDSEKQIRFNMSDIVELAKLGHTELIEQLFQATKIKIYELYGKQYKEQITPQKNSFIKYSVCTPKKGRSVSKENIGRIVENNDKLIAFLVDFHNKGSVYHGKPKVSLKEIRSLHQAIQDQNM